MNDISQSSAKGILVAVSVGAAVGAAVALLCAPCSGREARGWLANRTRDVKDGTTSAFEHGKEAVKQAAHAIKGDGEDGTHTRASTMRL